jgi:hypothetical protein
MNSNAETILLQIANSLGKKEWTPGKDWQLTFKTDEQIPLTRDVVVKASMDKDTWKDQVGVYITLKISSEDELTLFSEFTIYAQIFIGSIPSKDIVHKMMGNESFTGKDIKNNTKISGAAREIDYMVRSYINEIYQNYIDENNDLVRFYRQGLSENGISKSSQKN